MRREDLYPSGGLRITQTLTSGVPGGVEQLTAASRHQSRMMICSWSSPLLREKHLEDTGLLQNLPGYWLVPFVCHPGWSEVSLPHLGSGWMNTGCWGSQSCARGRGQEAICTGRDWGTLGGAGAPVLAQAGCSVLSMLPEA